MGVEEPLPCFLDEQFSESVAVVGVVEGSPQRFPLSGSSFHPRILHDELSRLVQCHSLRVHPEGDDETTVHQQCLLQLDKPESFYSVSFVEHHLFAVVCPALTERVVPVSLPRHGSSELFLEDAVGVVSRPDLVNRNLLQRHTVQMAEPLLGSLRIPSLLWRSHIVQSLYAFLLEWTWRRHRCRGLGPHVGRRRNHSDPGPRGNANELSLPQPAFKIV